ncbi:4-oxalocrotonate tautomerase [Carnimonas sp. R-84981]|uniref:tautomerase family protein n=1 Tax=Carnimonas bestiolae TaxID=3402172 RepID=UPI003EDB874B
MPIVTVQQFPRSTEQKRELVQRITAAFVDTCQVPAEAVQVFFQESDGENYAKGGVLGVDLPKR